MSEAAERDSKTEEATARKIEDALEKGNTPVSREVPLFAALAGLLVIGGFLMAAATHGAASGLARILENAGDWRLGSAMEATRAVALTLADAGLALLPVMAVIAAAGLLGSLVQNVPRIALARVMPDVSRISPVKGWSRIFGSDGMVEFLKSSGKLVLVTVAVAVAGIRELPRLIETMTMSPGLLPQAMLFIAMQLLAVAAIVAAVFAAGDFAWSRFSWRRNLRMTRQEVKDEMKQADGDPQMKMHMRQIARRKATGRMIAAVPQATLVITNPTHVAVALRYVRAEGGAPVVVAKGADHLAQKIREIAAAHNIPLLEDKPLARALHGRVEVGSMIPPEFYNAVAQLILVLRR